MDFPRQSISRELYTVYEYELDQFARVSNLHGLARWREARSSAKVFWAAVGIGIITFSISQVVSLVSLYFSMPTMSEVSLVTAKDGMQFPVVTICNYNPVKASVANEYAMDSGVLEYVQMSYMQPGDLYASYDFDQLEVLHKQYQTYVQDYKNRTGEEFSLRQFFWNAGYDCKELFLSCTFGGLPFDCCAYAEPLLTDMGKCHQFKNYGRNNARQFVAGPHYGFQAFINLQSDEYPMTSVNNLYNFGIRFSIQHDASTPTMNYGAFSVSPGNRFYAGILSNHHKLLPEDRWGNCVDEWPIEYTGNTSGSYSQRACRTQCEADSFLQRCNCMPQRYAIAHDVPVCTSLQLYTCAREGNTNFRDEEYWRRRCDHCAVQCSRWSYEIQSSYVKIPSPGASKTLQKRFNLTEYEVGTDLLCVTAYFIDIAYTQYMQMQATTLSQTFSDIGGTLGLFVGFTVVTMFELIIFIVKLLWGFVSRNRRRLLLVRNDLNVFSRRKYGVAPSPYALHHDYKDSVFYVIPDKGNEKV